MLDEFGLTRVVTNEDYATAAGEPTDGLFRSIQACPDVDYESHFVHASDLEAFGNFLRLLHKFPGLKVVAEEDEKVGWCLLFLGDELLYSVWQSESSALSLSLRPYSKLIAERPADTDGPFNTPLKVYFHVDGARCPNIAAKHKTRSVMVAKVRSSQVQVGAAQLSLGRVE